MADYPLQQEAAEVQKILNEALLINGGAALSEEEKTLVREKIGASAAGTGLQIIAHFDTVADLEAAVPAPTAGEAYSVGTETPYNLYIYDFRQENWKDYGPIRANDIRARLLQNAAVAVSAWEEDTNVFVDYSYKASIALAEISGNDFAIVGFSPSDANGGNFCPICYAFDGYVEIWAKAIPAAELIIPAVTLVINAAGSAGGNSTKGITNASGGIPTGGIGPEQIADGSISTAKVAKAARTQYFDVAVSTDWTGDAAPYAQTIAVAGLFESDRAVVRFSAPTSFDDLEAQQTAFALLYTAESANGSITLYAKDLPETAFAVVLEVARI